VYYKHDVVAGSAQNILEHDDYEERTSGKGFHAAQEEHQRGRIISLRDLFLAKRSTARPALIDSRTIEDLMRY
jgi:hypothetical protein